MAIKLSCFGDSERGNEHKVICGIGVVNCIYFNPKVEQSSIIDYRIYNLDSDKKTKIDYVK